MTNAARTRFFVQQKDEHYEPAPLGYSLFGGALEPGERPEQSLARELREELGPAAQRLLDAGPRHVFTTTDRQEGFAVSLFEIVLDEAALESLAEVSVLEGKRGVVLDRKALPDTPFVWRLDQVVSAYLARHAAAAAGSS